MRAALLLAMAAPALAVKLEPPAIEAFDRYMREAEARLEKELQPGGAWLWIDADAAQRAARYARLRAGEVLVETHQAPKIPGAMIHHRVAALFVPGATFAQALAVVEDYDHYQDNYAPDIVKSKLRARNGHDARIYLRIFKKKGLSATLDTEHEIHYVQLDAARGQSHTWTTRIAEVESPGRADEREKLPGNDRGFLWRLNSWWRFWEKDGGVYIQIESISLSRDAPMGLGWLVGTFINSVHREFLLHMITSTRDALLRGNSRAREIPADTAPPRFAGPA